MTAHTLVAVGLCTLAIGTLGTANAKAEEQSLSSKQTVAERGFTPAGTPSSGFECLWIDADSGATARVLTLLDKPVGKRNFDFVETPLAEVLGFVREEFGVTIIVDRRTLEDLGLGLDEPINFSHRRVKLGTALNTLLEELGLTTVVRDGVCEVTSFERALASPVVAIYDVADLLSRDRRYERVIDVIVTTIDQGSWAQNGTGHMEIRSLPERGCLVVSQTTATHQRIASLLRALRKLPPCDVEAVAADVSGATVRPVSTAFGDF